MNYIFSTGLPRSGTALLTKALYESNQASLAVGPNVEIYRFFRNKLINKYGSRSLKKKNKIFSPFQDYFGSSENQELLKLMLNGSLSEKFDKKDWKLFLHKSQKKTDHDSADLIKYFLKLKADSFKNIILNLIKIIKKKRKLRKPIKNKKLYYGFHETWNICSLNTLARSFPKAKFFVVIRDPRSVYASLSKNAEKRTELRVQLLSFCRHFRKYIILSNYFLSLPVLKKRLMIIKYEDLVTNPNLYLKKICKFLQINFNKNMVNPNKYYDFVTKKNWIPHSAFNSKFPKLNNKPIHKWKKYLTKYEVKSIEFLCQNEMRSMNYKLKYQITKNDISNIFKFIKKDYNKKVNWRTDLQNYSKDKRIETFRYKFLESKTKKKSENFKKSFLFDDYSLSYLKSHYQQQRKNV